MKLNAILGYKVAQVNSTPCEVTKIIELSEDKFRSFRNNLSADCDFIKENLALMGKKADGGYRCLLVLGKDCDDGILVESEGYDYARYMSFVPNARQIVFMEQRYNCIQDLENNLMDAADEVLSCANAYDGEGPYRALISDLTDEHCFDEQYVPLLLEMLGEHSCNFEFEEIDGEIMGYRKAPEQTQSDESSSRQPLPFSSERMEQLLNKTLDWVGEHATGYELYDTLKNTIGMNDEEISAAGFELEELNEDEEPGIIME